MPTGTLKRWLSDKGFGFISPDDGSADIFAHIRQKVGGGEEGNIEGRRVEYESEFEAAKGKPKAVSWHYIDEAPAGSEPAPPQGGYGGGYEGHQQQPQQHQTPPPPGGGYGAAAGGYSNGYGGGGYGGQQPMDQSSYQHGGSYGQGGQGGQGSQPDAYAGHAGGLPPPPGGAGGVVVQPPAAPGVATAPNEASEEVSIPEDFLQQVSAGLEGLRHQAGGDIHIEVVQPIVEPADGSRTLNVRGPPVSVSIATCLLKMQLCQLLTAVEA